MCHRAPSFFRVCAVTHDGVKDIPYTGSRDKAEGIVQGLAASGDCLLAAIVEQSKGESTIAFVWHFGDPPPFPEEQPAEPVLEDA